MAVNVNRNVVDPFYRYKMPSLVVKVEGRGNGVKTVIINLDDVARSLGRPAIYLIKYFSYELGTQTHFDSKNNRYIVNGLQDAGKLQDMLDLFIKNFVLRDHFPKGLVLITSKIKNKTKTFQYLKVKLNDLPPDNRMSLSVL